MYKDKDPRADLFAAASKPPATGLIAEEQLALFYCARKPTTSARPRECAVMALLEGETRFAVPRPSDDLLRPTVLPVEFQADAPIEDLALAPGDRRDTALAALAGLTPREPFGLMQTDPNFANCRWQADGGRIVPLDFGATRKMSPATARSCRRLLRAVLSGEAPGCARRC